MEQSQYFGAIDDQLIKNVFTNFDENKPKQKSVYHYTSLKSLKEILESTTLYFTSIVEQNDPQELVFGLRTIQGIIEKHGSPKNKLYKIINDIEKYWINKGINNIFIFATSSDNDDYSQWIKYGDSGYGVSIGIERIKLLNLMSKNIKNKNLVYNYPIQYYDNHKNVSKHKIKKFDEIIAKACDDLWERYFEEDGTQKEQEDVYNLLTIFASMIKDSFHSEENEWRYILISNILDEKDESVIIPQNRKLKMVKEIDIEENPNKKIENTIISDFTLGPIHTNDRSMSINLYRLIKEYYVNFEYTSVKYSKGIIR